MTATLDLPATVPVGRPGTVNTCRRSRPTTTATRVRTLQAGLLNAVGLLGFTTGTASAVTRAAAETRVGAFNSAVGALVEPSTEVSAVQGGIP